MARKAVVGLSLGMTALASAGCDENAMAKEPTALEAIQTQLLKDESETRYPTVSMTDEPVVFAPENLRGLMTEEEFRQRSADITREIRKLFKEGKSDAFATLGRTDDREAFTDAWGKIIFKNMGPIFTKYSLPISEKLGEIGLKSNKRFLYAINEVLRPNGSVLILGDNDGKLYFNLYDIKDAKSDILDDGYWSLPLRSLHANEDEESVITSYERRRDFAAGVEVTGTYDSTGKEIYSFVPLEQFASEYYEPHRDYYKGKNGEPLSLEEAFKDTQHQCTTHEATHILDRRRFPDIDRKTTCSIPQEYGIIGWGSTTPVQLGELSAIGMQTAASLSSYTAPFETILATEPDAHHGMPTRLLPYAILAATPDNQIKRDFITANLNNAQLDPATTVKALVTDNPDFDSETIQRVGQMMYAVAKKLQTTCAETDSPSTL